MCTYYDMSLYFVLQEFAPAKGYTVSGLRNKLGERVLELALGSSSSLDRFLEALEAERFLHNDNGTYTLTDAGRSKLERLKPCVAAVA